MSTFSLPVHTHDWIQKYDKHYHWQECKICGEVRNKEAHQLHGDGNNRYQIGSQKNVFYHDYCNCGYKSKPITIIPGRKENYEKSLAVNFRTDNLSAKTLNDIGQVSQKDFDTYYASKTFCGQKYTWWDNDGDGFGWVFCGGPTLSKNGVIGTIEMYVGTERDDTLEREEAELYRLASYIGSHGEKAARQGFIDSIEEQYDQSRASQLYHIREKYEKVSDAAFDAMKPCFYGWGVKPTAYNYSILHDIKTTTNCGNDGSWAYGFHCYDSVQNVYDIYSLSKNKHLPGHCDVCGTSYTGNEAYDTTQYLSINWWWNGTGIESVQTGSVSKYLGSVYGYGGKELAKVYALCTKTDWSTYTYTFNAVPTQDDIKISYDKNNTGPFTIHKNAQGHGTGWEWQGYVYCTYTYNGQTKTATGGIGNSYCQSHEKPPTINDDFSIKDLWLSIHGTEDAESVRIDLLDKETNEIAYTGSATVKDGKYMLNILLPQSAIKPMHEYQVTVTCARGLKTSKSFSLDASGNIASDAYTVLHEQEQLDGSYKVVDTVHSYGNAGKTVTPEVKNYLGFDSPKAEAFTLNNTGDSTFVYYYKRKSYKLTVNAGPGIASTTGSGTYKYEEAVDITAKTSDHYHFDKWQDGNTNRTRQITMPAGDMVYTAAGAGNPYTISFNPNSTDASGTMSDAKAVYDTELTLPENTYTRRDDVFTGWNTKADGSGQVIQNKETIKNLTEDKAITLYAMWQRKVEDLTVNNQVTGNLGDTTKAFSFTIAFEHLEVNHTYKTSHGDSFTADDQGSASYHFTLKSKEAIKLQDLPVQSTFAVTEQANNHDITASSNNGYLKSVLKGNALTTDKQTLKADQNTKITFKNDRREAAITGISGKPTIIILLLGLLGFISTVMILIKQEKRF